MEIVNKLERLKQIDKLIELENTGTPKEFASRLGISRSKLYEIIGEIKALGINIKYSRSQQSFYFEEGSARFNIAYRLEIIKGEEIKKISGGCLPFSSMLFSGRNTLMFGMQ